MSIITTIETRKSVRNFTGEPLSKKDENAILKFISDLKAPFGAKVRIDLIHAHTGDEAVKLGTYGVIKGASAFLTLTYEEGSLADQSAGYMFEQVILHCTQMGLGTCWVGGTFKWNNFAGQLNLKKGENLRIISPVGHPIDKKRWLVSLMRSIAKSDSRKPFEILFFKDNFLTPLEKEDAGDYLQPLEMVRLAPSASNTQPWRIVMKDNAFHFYYHKVSSFSSLDIGIAMCHFEQTCKELNLAGRYEVLKNSTHLPLNKDNTYVISWVHD